MDFHLDYTIDVLERTPDTLGTMLRGLPDAWTTGNEGPETWSPYDVMGHLIHGECTDWIPRARIILAQGSSVRFEPFDRFAMLAASGGRPLGELLDTFATLRGENLVTLRGWRLTAPQLALRGDHPELGSVTLSQHLATWTVHDLTHIAQIGRTMAKQYREAVGPWRRYFSALADSRT
jgi:hypothetical protein